MTEFELYCNFINAKKKANDLDKTAKKLRKVSKSISQDMSTVSSIWTGDSANVFAHKLVLFKEQIDREARLIESDAIAIKNKAEKIYRAELRAAEIAKKRTYR